MTYSAFHNVEGWQCLENLLHCQWRRFSLSIAKKFFLLFLLSSKWSPASSPLFVCSMLAWLSWTPWRNSYVLEDHSTVKLPWVSYLLVCFHSLVSTKAWDQVDQLTLHFGWQSHTSLWGPLSPLIPHFTLDPIHPNNDKPPWACYKNFAHEKHLGSCSIMCKGESTMLLICPWRPH